MKNSIGHRGSSVVMRPQHLPYPGSHQPFFSRRILDRGKPPHLRGFFLPVRRQGEKLTRVNSLPAPRDAGA